jgi:hypothetical protein
MLKRLKRLVDGSFRSPGVICPSTFVREVSFSSTVPTALPRPKDST